MKTLRKNKNKGFTLVEIIVVLVIIAILMAALAPVVIGWVNEARDSTLIAEGRTGLVAAQAIATDTIARAATPAARTNGDDPMPNTGYGTSFSDLLGGLSAGHFKNITWDNKGNIQSLYYQRGGTGNRVEYEATGAAPGTWKVNRNPS